MPARDSDTPMPQRANLPPGYAPQPASPHPAISNDEVSSSANSACLFQPEIVGQKIAGRFVLVMPR